MMNDEGVLINDPIEMTMYGMNFMDYLAMNLDERKYELTIKGIKYDFFPNKQILTFNPVKGKIMLESKKQVYGILYKDACASNIPTKKR